MKRGHKAPTIRTDDTGQKMRCFIKDFFNKCDQIRRKLRIWSRLLKESSMKNFIFLCSAKFPQHKDPWYLQVIFQKNVQNQIQNLRNRLAYLKKNS